MNADEPSPKILAARRAAERLGKPIMLRKEFDKLIVEEKHKAVKTHTLVD